LTAKLDSANWVFHLSAVVLSLNTMFKEDMKGSAACMVCDMIAAMKIFAGSLLSTPIRVQQSTTEYIPKDLQTCSHIFIRESPIKTNLTPAYSGPYIVLSRNDKVFTVLKDDKAIKVAINNVKPSFCLDDQFCPPYYATASSSEEL